MEKSSPITTAYLRFLQLARVLDDGSERLDANEVALLNAVSLRWYEGSPMTVREAMDLAHLGSPATLHKRITRLRDSGHLVAENHENDRRAKRLIPSEKTLQHFGQLSTQLKQAVLSLG